MPSSPRRPSASPAWGRGRELLVAAAQELFSERGFSAVSTREIAARAEVSEPMIFRHFGSKAGLFEVAVLTPFVDHLAGYVDDWENRPHHVRDPLDEARDFYRGAYTVFSANRHLIRTLLEAESGPGTRSGSEVFTETLAPILDRLANAFHAEQEARGFRRFNPALQVRLMMGLAVSQAVLGPWAYAGSEHEAPTDDEIVEEMALMTVYGAWDPPQH